MLYKITGLFSFKKLISWKTWKNWGNPPRRSQKAYKTGYNTGSWMRRDLGLEGNFRYIWRRQWHPSPVLLPGKSHGWRSLEGCSPWGRWRPDMTEGLHFHFSLSCIGEENGNPLQCSCLENPRDGGAWWAAIHGVAQSRTWLKRLSSNSSSSSLLTCIFTVSKGHNGNVAFGCNSA